MWNKLKKVWSLIIRFFEEYSVDNLIGALSNLIKHIIENGISSGNILIRLVSIPPLLVFVLLLGVVLGIKKLFTNFIKLIKKGFWFVTKIITLIVKEVDYYWEAANNKGKSLVETEKFFVSKLMEYSKYQLQKIKDDDAELSNKFSEKGYMELTFSFIVRLVYWLMFVLLALSMSVILAVVPISIPVSKYIRSKIKKIGSLQTHKRTDALESESH